MTISEMKAFIEKDLEAIGNSQGEWYDGMRRAYRSVLKMLADIEPDRLLYPENRPEKDGRYLISTKGSVDIFEYDKANKGWYMSPFASDPEVLGFMELPDVIRRLKR